MLEQQHAGAGYEGTDEYVPAGADSYEVKHDAPRVVLNDGAIQSEIQSLHIWQWNAEAKIFTVQLERPGELALRLFNYPAWGAEVNGQPASTSTREVTGQILIPVQAGESRVTVTFKRTWDRILGGIISGITALFLGGLFIIRRRRQAWLPGKTPLFFSIPQENDVRAK